MDDYQRAMQELPELPAQCSNPYCGLIFRSGLKAMMAMSNVTTCPRCGSDAPIANAFADVQPGQRAVYHASDQRSRRMLDALQSIVARAHEGTIDRATAVAEAKEISSTAKKAVDWAFRLQLLGLLLLIIQMSYQYDRDSQSDRAEIARVRTEKALNSTREAEQLLFAQKMFSLLEEANYTQRQVLEAVKQLNLPANRKAADLPQRRDSDVIGNRKVRRAAASRARRSD